MRSFIVALGFLVSGSAHAAAGDLFVVENPTGRVVEFSTGTPVEFATGLDSPYGICVGPGGQVLVAESGVGEISNVTEGGEITESDRFAWATGFFPVGLFCDDQLVLVSDSSTGLVLDATLGGDLLGNPIVFAQAIPFPGPFALDDAERLFNASSDLYDITEGGLIEGPAYTTGQSLFSIEFSDGRLLAGDLTLPRIFDATGGGDLSAAAPWATLPDLGGNKVDGILDAGELGLFALSGDQVFEISGGGDLTAATPFATGFDTGQLGFHGMLHHVCSTDADCADGDLCNGDESCDSNGCLPPESELDCDDSDLCTIDTCDPVTGCDHQQVPDCCDEDLDCTIDEICDLDAEVCVPVDVVTTGGDDDPSDSSCGVVDDTSGAAGDESGSTTGATAGETDEGGGGGCGCRHRNPAAIEGLLVLFLFGVARRRAYH